MGGSLRRPEGPGVQDWGVDIVPQGRRGCGCGPACGSARGIVCSGVCGVSVGCLDGKTPRIRQADAPAHGGAMSNIGIATSRSGVFLKLIEEIRRNLLIYKSINIYAQKLWITL